MWAWDQTGSTWWDLESYSETTQVFVSYDAQEDEMGWIDCSGTVFDPNDPDPWLNGEYFSISVANVLWPCASCPVDEWGMPLNPDDCTYDMTCSLLEEGKIYISADEDVTTSVTIHHGMAGTLTILAGTNDLEVLNPDETTFTSADVSGSGVSSVPLLLRAGAMFSGEVALTARFLQDGADLDSQDVVIAAEEKPTVTINSIDSNFAPGSENCRINYTIEAVPGQPVAAARMEIWNDKTERILLDENIEREGTHDYDWSGSGATVATSPFTVYIYASSNANYDPAGSDDAETSVLIGSIDVERDPLFVDDEDFPDRFYVNDPDDYESPFYAIVTVLNKAGDEVPGEGVRVRWEEQPGPNNTQFGDSFKYNPMPPPVVFESDEYLGKDGDYAGSLVYFNPIFSTTFSFMRFDPVTMQFIDCAEADVDFIPSGVGGDVYAVKGMVLKHDNTELASDTSDESTVWRTVGNLGSIYEMDQVDHISELFVWEGGVQDKFDPAFVQVETGLVLKIAPEYSVEYIGLWKDNPNGTSPEDFQKDWEQIQQKLPEETPQPGDDDTVVQQKAQAWADRILSEYDESMATWGARYPNAIVGVVAIHPKFDFSNAGVTYEWTAYNVTVNVLGVEVDPDAVWYPVNGGYIAATNTAVVAEYAGSHGDLASVVAHEIGHATKGSFPRDLFGPGDHTLPSLGDGLMRPNGGADDEDFSEPERMILRGIVPEAIP